MSLLGFLLFAFALKFMAIECDSKTESKTENDKAKDIKIYFTVDLTH